MNLPFKPHYIALVCSAGLLAASGTLYVKSREPTVPEAPLVAAVATVPEAPPATTATTTTAPTYTTAQITQWVAPIALYPDPLLSQVLMASTYPDSVTQAVQWSKDHPGQQGDAAVQAVAGQPWDASVKSLVAFPQLTGMMGEDPQWVTNLGNAFLAQPQDVMDAVQKLRQLAQQTGSLKSTPQQTVTTAKRTVAPSTSSSSSTQVVSSSAPTVIKIESTDPQVVYVPNYNPTVVYGSSWPYTSAPPVYLPPPPGEQFADSFVRGFGYSLGVATTYAIFSNIDWDDDDHHHDDDHHDGGHPPGGGYQHNGDNININVNNFNKITGQNISGQTQHWQHNPAYRGNVPYPNNNVANQFHQTNVPGGLSATRQTPALAAPHQTDVAGGLSATQHATPNRDTQRQAAMQQLNQRNHSNVASTPAQPASRDAQRRAASQQFNQTAQRNNFRGYDAPASHTPTRTTQQRAAAQHVQPSRPQLNDTQRQNLQRDRQSGEKPHLNQDMMGQRSALQARRDSSRSNAFSGNESRAPSWQSQQSRGQESRRASGLGNEQRSGGLSEHHEFRRR